MPKNIPNSKQPSLLKIFIIELLSGIVIFSIVASTALGFSFLAKLLANAGVDPIIVKALTTMEYFLFMMDIVLFTFFVVKSVVKARAGKKL